jgi:hypothetical protein
MLETLFQYPAVVTRQRSGPFAEARERFLNHCASQGLARATLVRRVDDVLALALVGVVMWRPEPPLR